MTTLTSASADELAAIVTRAEARCSEFNPFNDAGMTVDSVRVRRDLWS